MTEEQRLAEVRRALHMRRGLKWLQGREGPADSIRVVADLRPTPTPAGDWIAVVDTTREPVTMPE